MRHRHVGHHESQVVDRQQPYRLQKIGLLPVVQGVDYLLPSGLVPLLLLLPAPTTTTTSTSTSVPLPPLRLRLPLRPRLRLPLPLPLPLLPPLLLLLLLLLLPLLLPPASAPAITAATATYQQDERSSMLRIRAAEAFSRSDTSSDEGCFRKLKKKSSCCPPCRGAGLQVQGPPAGMRGGRGLFSGSVH